MYGEATLYSLQPFKALEEKCTCKMEVFDGKWPEVKCFWEIDEILTYISLATSTVSIAYAVIQSGYYSFVQKSTSHHINTLRFEGLPCTKPIRSILLSHFIVERRLFFQWCSFSLEGAFVVITLCTSQIVLSSLFGNQLFHLHWPWMFAKHDPLCWISSIIGHAPL